MIRAHFEDTKLIINISWMDQKYKEYGKKITFTLYYWTEYNWSNWWELYRIEAQKEIEYSWEDEVILEVDRVKKWYRWRDIFIWYYIDINFWRKFLIFKDSKEINISGREGDILYVNNLPQNSKYTNTTDEYSYEKILKNLSSIRKFFLWLFFVITIIWLVALFIREYSDFWKWLIIFWIIAFWLVFFTSGRWYFEWRLTGNIKDWDDIKSIISWKISLDLEELKIQIFAYNSEKGNYEVSDGSTTRTVWFNTQVWNVLLFEKTFYDVKAWTDIKDILEWKLDVEKIYTNLFPSIEIIESMWLFLNLEFRLISKNYKDIYIKNEIHLDEKKFILKKKPRKKNFNKKKEDSYKIEKVNDSDYNFF